MKHVIITSNWFDTKMIDTNDAKEILIKKFLLYYKNVAYSQLNNDNARIITNDGQVIEIKILEE